MSVIKDYLARFIAVIMALVMITVLTACDETPPVMTERSYTITVENKGGTALSKCKIDVYTDDTKSAIVFTGITDANGQVNFTSIETDNYVAVVSKQPDGYALEESYTLTGESTTIVLAPGVMTDADMDSVKYSLGEAVMDFTVTAPDGTEYVLSNLLKEKKAVVLNFWYLNCDPCKMEFPYLQEAYEKLGDDIAVLALNPYDGDDASVAAFQADNGYTFPMLKCDARWKDMMQVQMFPMTVVIDRYGNICLIHHGMVTDTQTFLNMFGYFVSDEYEQKFFKSVGQMPAYET